jgi:hypothetical protein
MKLFLSTITIFAIVVILYRFLNKKRFVEVKPEDFPKPKRVLFKDKYNGGKRYVKAPPKILKKP